MAESTSIFFSIFIIFSGAALVATLALFTRQPLLIAYIFLGALLGPFGFGLVTQQEILSEISEIGIIFLLFLIGLDMQPSNLFNTLKNATTATVVSSFLFACIGFGITKLFGFGTAESMVVGLTMMFSSTIIGIKLLPTTVLHHKHTGELMVGILLVQDIIAILVLLALGNVTNPDSSGLSIVISLASLPFLILISWLFVKFVLLFLLQKFDRFQEYIFLLAIGWCLGVAELASVLGLSQEVGAFIAGVSIASSPISYYIASALKPLRDFFLILFFFTVGAGINLELMSEILLPGALLAVVFLTIKPITYRLLLERLSESKKLAWDVGFRLGQNSEFSILIAYIALASGLIGEQASLLIQLTAIITFAISSYVVVLNFPNPIAIKDHLRRD